MRKRHFQLLEVLIALFLVLLCAVPIISSSVSMYQEQRQLHERILRDHWAHLAQAKIIEWLYIKGAKGESLKEILDKRHPIQFAAQTEGQSKLMAQLESSPYQFSYELYLVHNQKFPGEENADKLLLELDVYALKKGDRPKERPYRYNTYIKRMFNEGQKEELVKRKRIKDP